MYLWTMYQVHALYVISNGKRISLKVNRSNILETEAFRNLLGESLRQSSKRVVILSAYVKKIE